MPRWGPVCSSRPVTPDGRCGSRTRWWPIRSIRSWAPGTAVGSTAAPCTRCDGATTRSTSSASYPILEPFGEQVAFNGATSQGYIGAYLGKLASLLGQHDLADAHLKGALDVNVSFGWSYHEATTLIALAISQRRRTGTLDATGRAWLDRAAAIAAECGSATVASQVARARRGDAPL